MGNWTGFLAGTLAGGLSRLVLGGAIQRLAGAEFPYGTLVVNLLGCLLMGLFHGWAQSKPSFSPALQLALMTGFCGAFTTLSSLVLEASQLLRGAGQLRSLAYAAATVLLGFLLFRLGEARGKSRLFAGDEVPAALGRAGEG